VRRLTRAVVARPRLTLAAWGFVMVVLAVAGIGIQDRLQEGGFVLPGTETARATQLEQQAFGSSELSALLLEGPRATLDLQGRRLVADLRRRWTVLSPWDGGPQASRLRRSPTSVLVLVDLTYGKGENAAARLAPLRRTIAADVHAPVGVHLTGSSVGADATNRAALDAADQAQKIAFPVLLLVLLLVFRSPVAAAIPAVVGFGTVLASTGVIALVTRVHQLSAVSVSVAAMMGLALGVDYSLLIVSRFREERGRANSPAAAEVAAATAGRTVLFAGLVLIVAMALALAMSPGAVLFSIAAGVVIAAALSLVAAATVVPAALTLVGPSIERWRIGGARTQSRFLTRAAGGAMRHAPVVVPATILLLLALAVPALGMRTSPPVLSQIPQGKRARVDFDAIERAVGPGYVTPFEIVVRAGTQPAPLREVEGLEQAVARERGVSGVAGPAPLAGSHDQGAMFLGFDRTGATARIYVFPRYVAAAAGNARVRARLLRRARDFERRTGLQALVGGLAAQYVEFERDASSYLPLLILALAAVTVAMLAMILRAIVLPVVAVLLNLAIIAAAFGIVNLVFQGSHPLLGGPGFLDLLSVAAVLTVQFALSVDYEVFLLTRMHESHAIHGDPDRATMHGIGSTASVVSGAALIMTAVFVCFAINPFSVPRQFGVGLSIAVLLDALLLRLFLLPAAMRLLGRWSWWLPAWLDTRIPRLGIERADGRVPGERRAAA